MNTIQKGIAVLLRSGITGEKLPMPEGFALEEAYDVLCRHSVAPLAYHGALNCGFDQRDAVMQKLFRLYLNALTRSEKQLRALEKLFAAFEENGIPFMPLKGCNIKKLYPLPELRAMGDADILIHAEDYDRIRPLMEANGFHMEKKALHVYEWRSEVLLIELHTSMISPNSEDYFAYYGTGWQFAQESNTSRHDLSREDAYLFMVTHFAQHYRHGGIGCRHVTDFFVYHRQYPDLNRAYVADELEKLGIVQFYNNLMRMLEVWFEGTEQDEITELMTEFVFSSGNWGTYKAHILLGEVKNAEIRGQVKHSRPLAVLNTLFLPYRTLVRVYSWLENRPVLLPVAWIVRASEVLTKRPKSIGRKLGALCRVDDEGVLSYQRALKKVGLDFGAGREDNIKQK